jgi:hypothetical protein
MDAEGRHDIMKVESFVDSKGHEVRQFSQVYGKNKILPFYHGVAAMRVRMRMTNGQEAVQERTVEFPFPDGGGLQKAFESFDDVAKKHMDAIIAKEQEQAAEARRIVQAKSIPRLVGANGKPVGV